MFWLNVAIILSSVPSLTQGHGYLIDRDLIAKKDGFKFNFQSGSGIIRDQEFRSLGCWKDTWIRAIQPLEKRHKLLIDGNYKLREDPLRKCAIAALDNNMKLFAIENGGQCLGDTIITTSYMRYGIADHCKDDGYGGPWSMQVYGFTGRRLKRRHGGYTQWSMWTKCSNTCGKGTQKRHRTCTNPSPTHSGRNCESLGPAIEERSCEKECLGTEDDESDNPDQAHRSTAKNKKPSDDLDDDDEDDDYDDDEHDSDDETNTSDGETSNTDNVKVTKPRDNAIQSSVDKTKSRDLGLKSTSDTTKPNTEIAHYESVLSKKNSNSANTAATTNNQVNSESRSDAFGISDQPVAPLSQGTTDIQPSSAAVNPDQSKSHPLDSETTENDALSIPPIPNNDTNTDKSPGTTDNQPGSTGESNKSSESDDLPPPDDGKSTTEEFPDSETSDDDVGEKTKDSTKQGASTTPSDKTDLSSSSKGLPDQEQVKAAQDLLRSRWLSLAKTGKLKPIPTEPSLNSPQPVVDVALKDDGEEDFEDKEMENEPVKDDKQNTNLMKVDDLTGKQDGQEKNVDASQLNVKKIDEQVSKNDGKQEVQEKNVDATQLNVKKIDEQVSKNDGKQEVQGGNVEGSQLNGNVTDSNESDLAMDVGKQKEQENNVEGSQVSGMKTEDKVDEETTDSKTEMEQNNKANNLQKNEKKTEDTTDDHSIDGMNKEGQDADVDDQEDEMDEQHVNEEKTNGKENNQPVEGSQVVEHEGNVDEKQIDGDNAKGSEGDESVKEEEMEDQVEGSNDHEEVESEMKGTEERVDGNIMDDGHTKKMTQETGARRIKEECVCPKVDLMGKVMPNPKPCPCTINPSKKASMTESPRLVQDQAVGRGKKFNAEMTKEEYKTGMFHETVLPKIHTSPITPAQKPSSDTTLSPISSNAIAGNAELPKTQPSGGNSPAPKISHDTSGASQLALSPIQQASSFKSSPQPVTGLAPQPASPTPLSKNTRENDEVVHIKHGKFKPLSKTLSALGESINKAQAKGELKEGSDSLNTDIHNLLKTIGKLKSQVDILRNDQTEIVSKSSSQSEDTSESAGQSSSSTASPISQSTDSYENAGESQPNTSTVDESDSRAGKEKLLKTKNGNRIPLKLRIIGKTANKKLRNPTILRLKLGGQLKPVQNTAKVKPVQNTAKVKPVQNSGQVKPVQNSGQVKPAVEDPTIHQINSVSTSSVNTELPQTASTNTKQPQQTGSPAKLEKPETQNTTPNGDVKFSQSTNVVSGKVVAQPQSSTTTSLKQDQQNTQNIVGTKPKITTNTATEDISPQAISTPQTQSHTAPSGTQAVASANLTPAKPAATVQTATISATPPAPPTTTAQTAAIPATQPTQSEAKLYKPKKFLQDTKMTKPTTHSKTTNDVLQQIITTQKVKPLQLNTQVSPATQSGIATGNTKLPSTNTLNPKPLQQSVISIQKAEVLPQISSITQTGVTTSTVPHTVSETTLGQPSTTNPEAASITPIQTPVQRKPNTFAAIESQLAKDPVIQKKPVQKVLSIPDCNINLGFVLDGSASVEGTRRGNFLKMINFVKDVIHSFVKLSQQVHVGTLVYSTNTSLILSFGTKGTEKVIDQILDSVHYPGQGSLTGKAIKEAWNQMFSSVPRGRKSKLILLTDGPSNDDTKVPSKWVRDNGVEIFVIGLGKGYDESELAEMASLPSNKHMMFKDYDDLRTSVQEVRNKVCGFTADQVLQIMTSPGYSDGTTEINAFRRNFGSSQCILDVVFLLDGSRQVETNGVGNFQREINFVKKAVKYLPVSRNDVHIGVGLLGDANVMVFALNEHYIQNSIDYELSHIRYPASSDIQSEELKYARKLMLTKGARDVANRVFVLVTDVSSIDSYRRAIDELRTEGSDVAMLGVGTSLWKQEVKVRSSVQGLVDQVVSLESGDDDEAAKNFAFNMCKLSNAKKRTEIPMQHWAASNKILNKN